MTGILPFQLKRLLLDYNGPYIGNFSAPLPRQVMVELHSVYVVRQWSWELCVALVIVALSCALIPAVQDTSLPSSLCSLQCMHRLDRKKG